MNKTRKGFDWEDGYYTKKTLSRSFETLEEAETFAQGKDVVDIYRSNGKYKVEWIKQVKE